jgi:hypothetical protein
LKPLHLFLIILLLEISPCQLAKGIIAADGIYLVRYILIIEYLCILAISASGRNRKLGKML